MSDEIEPFPPPNPLVEDSRAGEMAEQAKHYLYLLDNFLSPAGRRQLYCALQEHCSRKIGEIEAASRCGKYVTPTRAA